MASPTTPKIFRRKPTCTHMWTRRATCSASKPSLEDLTQAIEEHEGKLEVPEQLRGAKVVYDSESILKALDSLSQSDREVLQLHYFQGLSRAQVADHLGVSMAAARQLQHTALRRLQVALKREEPGTVDDADLEAFLFTL